MKMKPLFIPGKPIAQPRHKITCVGGHARAYLELTAPIHQWKDTISVALMKHRLCNNMIDQCIKLTATFYLPLPKGNKVSNLSPHTKKPDLDNLLKALMDTLTDNKVWVDDSVVSQIDASKMYCDDPGVQFSLAPIAN